MAQFVFQPVHRTQQLGDRRVLHVAVPATTLGRGCKLAHLVGAEDAGCTFDAMNHAVKPIPVSGLGRSSEARSLLGAMKQIGLSELR